MCTADGYVFARSIVFTVGTGITGDAVHSVSALCVAHAEAVHHLVMVPGDVVLTGIELDFHFLFCGRFTSSSRPSGYINSAHSCACALARLWASFFNTAPNTHAHSHMHTPHTHTHTHHMHSARVHFSICVCSNNCCCASLLLSIAFLMSDFSLCILIIFKPLVSILTALQIYRLQKF